MLQKEIPVNTVPIPATSIEFRFMATNKKVASAIRLIEIIEQPAKPDPTSIKVDGSELTFPQASTTNPFEFVILHGSEVIDLATVKWKKVTNDKPVNISKFGTFTPTVGDVIYYRLAMVANTKTGEVKPASMYGAYVITSVIVPKQ